MAAEFGCCPQCASRMVIERMACWRCDTGVTGRLGVPLLARLASEEAEFVREFLLCNGSLSATQERLGCSYPKVRRLLAQTMETLRREMREDLRLKDDVVRAIEDGTLKGSDAVRLIRGMTVESEVKK